MSILDAIYKQSETVVDNLGGMEESLLLMQKQDKKEYKQESDHRKYQKEYDKRKRQDESRIVNVIQRSVQEKEEEKKKQSTNRDGGLGGGLAAAGLAGVIATAIRKYNKAVSVSGGGGSGGGGGQPEAPSGGGGGGPAPTPGTIDPGEAGTVRGAVSLSSLITAFIPGVRQIQEGAEIVTDLAAGDIVGAVLSGLSLLPFPAGPAASLIDSAWHMFIKSDEQRAKENEQLADTLNKLPGIINVDKVLEAFKSLRRSVGFQSGGFAGMVPNLGQPSTGDHFYTHVDPGSFVLNRNAVAAMGFQGGGTVPVALEQGEMVFSPGTFDAHMMDLINSSIPRFQVGGIVESSHDHTGSGFSVGKDYKGRPAIFSRAAATAMMKMIKDSKGTVRSSDITSSKRSPSYNARVGGVANSNHLTGNAVDYQSGTAGWHWIKENGSQYGWVFNNYLGPSGWHFDFKGGGNSGAPQVQGQPPKEDKERKNEVQDTSPQVDQEDSRSEPQDQFSGLLSGMGKAGAAAVNYLKQVDAALGLGDMGLSVVGIMTGANPLLGMMNALGGGGQEANAATTENPMGTGGGSGGGSVNAPPVTPGAKGLLDFISHYESGGSYNKIFGGANVPGLTDKTIREVVQIQKNHLKKGFESAAIGRYQMMYPDVYARKAGLSLDDKFSAANQDKMAMVYLEEDGWTAFKEGRMSADKFADNVAGTWAALPTRSGRSVYAGVGSNKSLVDRATYMKQINASKMMKGGMIGALTGSITNDLIKFFEQSEIQNRYVATSGEPNVIMMNDEEPEESIAAVTVGNNLPSFDIPPRDSCPLSMYYIYNPSFNPIGIGVS